MTSFQKKAVVWIGIFILLIAVLYYGGLMDYFSLTSIKSNAGYLKRMTLERYAYSVGMFLIISTLLVLTTLPLTGPIAIVGGFLYGALLGSVYSMIAILIGTACGFIIFKYLLSNMLHKRYEAQIQKYGAHITEHGVSYLVTLQLLTVVPFFIIVGVAAVTNVSLASFMLSVILGSTPVIAIYAFAGRQLHAIQSFGDILSVEMLVLLGLFALIALMPMIIKKVQKKRHGADQ